MNRTFIICIVLMMVFSCKKEYEFGPKHSLRSAKARVCNKWKIHKIFNSNGPSSHFPPECEIAMTDLDHLTTIEFKKDNTVSIENLSYNPNYPTNPKYYTGEATWEFYNGLFGPGEEHLNKNEAITVKPNIDYQICYKILRLKNNELWLYGRWFYEISYTTSGYYALKLEPAE